MGIQCLFKNLGVGTWYVSANSEGIKRIGLGGWTVRLHDPVYQIANDNPIGHWHFASMPEHPGFSLVPCFDNIRMKLLLPPVLKRARFVWDEIEVDSVSYGTIFMGLQADIHLNRRWKRR